MSAAKGILEFDLVDSDGKRRFRAACKAEDLVCLLWSFSEYYLRRRVKEGIPTSLEEVREVLYDLMDEYGIDLEDLT